MNDPLVSFNAPFQSGDGLCYPIYPMNYYKTETSPMFGGRKKSQNSQKYKKGQKGGNTICDYSQPSTINDYPGDAYLSSLDQRYALTGSGVPQAMNPLTENFLSNNIGITYATQAGGKRKNKKGGIGAGSFDGQIGALQGKQNENSGTLNRAQSQRGGYNVVAEEEMMRMSSLLSDSGPMQGMYPVLSGGKYRKYNKKGGNYVVAEEEMMRMSSLLSDSKPTQGMYPVLSGGKYRKYNKKGGNMASGMPPGTPSLPLGVMLPDASTAPAGYGTAGSGTAGSGVAGSGMPPPTSLGTFPNVAAAGTTGMPPPTSLGTFPNVAAAGTTGMPPPTSLGTFPNVAAAGTTGASPATDATGMTPEVAAAIAAMAAGRTVMSGGRYKKYSKKGGNYIFTPGANFSSQPAGIATQMDPLAQAQHPPKGMKDMSGVDAQMAASSSFLDIMSGGRKKSSRKLRGGNSDYAMDDISELNAQIEEIMSGGRKKSSRKLKGGVSDFATTLSSRGPINYPDQPSADRFRYFNKTGSFIPNSQLQYAAAPISTGYETDPNPYPMAYNDYIGGTAKNNKPAKKKAAPAKKKAASNKKKSTSDKKK
jgi:hypothetical protein